MIQRSLSIYYFISAIIALGILALQMENTSVFQLALYADIYIFCCILAATLLWKKKTSGYAFALLPSVSQAVRPIGDSAWLNLPPPISLGFPVGDFSIGQGFIVDVLALAISVLLIYCLAQRIRSVK